MTQKQFLGRISGTESPRTKIFALFGSSHMTGPGPSIKNFGVLGEYVELLNQLILRILRKLKSRHPNKIYIFWQRGVSKLPLRGSTGAEIACAIKQNPN